MCGAQTQSSCMQHALTEVASMPLTLTDNTRRSNVLAQAGVCANELESVQVLLAAGDTFRAAAAEQLAGWAQRAGAQLEAAASEKQRPDALLYAAVDKVGTPTRYKELAALRTWESPVTMPGGIPGGQDAPAPQFLRARLVFGGIFSPRSLRRRRPPQQSAIVQDVVRAAAGGGELRVGLARKGNGTGWTACLEQGSVSHVTSFGRRCARGWTLSSATPPAACTPTWASWRSWPSASVRLLSACPAPRTKCCSSWTAPRVHLNP